MLSVRVPVCAPQRARAAALSMGCATSKNANQLQDDEAEKPSTPRDVDLSVNEPVLLWLGHAEGLPSLDVLSESDVFVEAALMSATGTALRKVKWPVKWDCNNPIWNSSRELGKPTAGCKLVLSIYDHDEGPLAKASLIGTASVKLSELVIGAAPTTLPVVLKGKGKKGSTPQITIKRLHAEVAPPRKTIYLIRHGESVWNAAQANRDVVGMLSAVDHPLNANGRAQAEKLAERIAEGGADADEFLRAQLVVCSPLTRAIQTCLVGVAPLLGTHGTGSDRPRGHVLLNPNAREKRNFGGKDSSGQWFGKAIVDGIGRAMRELYPAAAEADGAGRAERLLQVDFDLELVQMQWWLGSKEAEEQVVERTAELLAQLRYCESTSIVVVGHSHYFRELFRSFMDASTVQQGSGMPDLQDLQQKKLMNCGVAAVDFDWALGDEKPIRGVRLLFGTELVD